MNKKDATLTVTIDNKLYNVQRGMTILQAAEENDIYIPTLCSHKDLTPYGGCRMCIVEVDGMRNFPTACTTPVEEGMAIKTHTAQVHAVRVEILQLLLSEHPSSCLICDEKEECKEYSGTIRKAGITTGCRYCSNDGQCELQEVVEKMAVQEIEYPIYYRQQLVEKEDPFYDRDYNLCILCGRCIRMCQEVRIANVLAFKHRGRNTIIGPAYGRTHLDAGCEFCGACVSVCPTGALTEKTKAWELKPDREEITTCSFCGVGCQMRLLVKDDRIIGSLPFDDLLVNNGQLCVKGRFCITELVNNYRRLKRPYKTYHDTKVETTWKEAIELVAEKLSACSPEEFGLLISPNCSNEDLYVAQKFTRVVMGSPNIDSSARLFYGSGFNAYLNLMRNSDPLSEIRKADAILCVGLDTRFGRSVVGVELRRAIKSGAKIITINPRDHNLTLIAEKWIQPVAGTEADLLYSLTELTNEKNLGTSQVKLKGEAGNFSEELSSIAEMLENASASVILVGSEFLQYHNSPQILEAIKQLAQNVGAGVMPLPAQNNLLGSIIMGVYPEFLPGGFSSTNTKRINELKKRWNAAIPAFSSKWNAQTLSSGKKLKVLYLIGEILPNSENSPADFLIAQNIYPTDSSSNADFVLPSAAFTEADGTFINGEGRIQRVKKAVNPPGEALPDWEILCRIAQKMGVSGFNFTSAGEIHQEISDLVNGFGDFDNPKRDASPLKCEGEFIIPSVKPSPAKKTDKNFPFILCSSINEHTYRGFSLSSKVDGAKKIFSEQTIDINPEDAKKARISSADEVVVSSAQFEKIFSARILKEQQRGQLHVTLPLGVSIGLNPHPVKIRKKNV